MTELLQVSAEIRTELGRPSTPVLHGSCLPGNCCYPGLRVLGDELKEQGWYGRVRTSGGFWASEHHVINRRTQLAGSHREAHQICLGRVLVWVVLSIFFILFDLW